MADKREGGGSSIGGGKSKAAKAVGDGESILIVHTWHHIFAFDLNSKPRGDPIIDPPVPSLLKALDLVNEQLPMAMGVLRVGTDLFMFGGEMGVNKVIPHTGNSVPVVDESFGFFGMVNYVYKLNPSSLSLEPTDEVMPPAAAKCYPMCVNINGMIYVFQGFRMFRGTNPMPIFEVFDTTDKCWKHFPEVPGFEEISKKIHRRGTIYASFIVGCRIYIVFNTSTQFVFCLNTETGQWEKENASNMHNSFDDAGIAYPSRVSCVSGLDLKDGLNVILSTDGYAAYAYLIDDMGNLLCYQTIEEIYGDLEVEHIAGVEGSAFTDTKTGQKCLVFTAERWSRPDPDSLIDYVVCISRFQVTKLSAADGPYPSSPGEYRVKFLEIGGVTLQVCTLPDVGRLPSLAVRDAFFL